MLGDTELGQTGAEVAQGASILSSVVGVVSKLFGGSGKPHTAEAALSVSITYSQGRQGFYQDGEWTRYASGNFVFSHQHLNVSQAEMQSVADGIKSIADSVKSAMQNKGESVSGFDKDWAKQTGGLTMGGSLSSIKSLLNTWTQEYLQFASGMSLQSLQTIVGTSLNLPTVTQATYSTISPLGVTPTTQPVTQASMFGNIPSWAWILIAVIGVTTLTGVFTKKYY